MRREILLVLGLCTLMSLVACSSGLARLGLASSADAPAAQADARRSGRERARIHTELAEGYFQLQNYPVALDEVGIALAADSQYGPAHNVKGLIHLALEQNDQAEAAFRPATQIDPADSDARNNYGILLCRTGRVDAAVDQWVEAARNPLYATPEQSHVNAGLCLLGARRATEARQLLVDYGQRRGLSAAGQQLLTQIEAELAGATQGERAPVGAAGGGETR